jgi:glycosyltransferase involved in cell wall biosynthesis
LQATPLTTIAIVTLNRAWIIDKAISSIKSQTYPHKSMFVLIVDGESKDGTPELSRKLLSESDFNGFEVVIQKSSIPEARNICLKKKRGELLLFWDSDVILPPNAVSTLVETLQKENADLVTTEVKQITVKSKTEKIDDKLQEPVKLKKEEAYIAPVKSAMMGETLHSKKLTDNFSFDPDLTTQEDIEFCLRAKEKGYKLIINRNIVALDVNMYTMAHSDISIDMTLKDALRGVRKKSKVQVYTFDFSVSFRAKLQFLKQYKRYGFYLLYLPTAILSVCGILLLNVYLALVFPVYAILYTGLQVKKRGIKKGFKAFLYSLIVGIPDAVWFAYYYIKYSLTE